MSHAKLDAVRLAVIIRRNVPLVVHTKNVKRTVMNRALTVRAIRAAV